MLVVGIVYDKIICSKGIEQMSSVNDTAQDMMSSHLMATNDKHAEIEHLVGDFKPTDELSDDVYHTCCTRQCFGATGMWALGAESSL